MPRKDLTYAVSNGEPKLDWDVRVALSQFTAACLISNNWKATPSQILKAVQYGNNHLRGMTKEQLAEGLDAACAAGCLRKDDNAGTYELTGRGVDVTGVEYSPPGRVSRKPTNYKYFYMPKFVQR